LSWGWRWRVGCFLLCLPAPFAWTANAQSPSKQQLDQEYQAAVADYEAGRLPQAADELQRILPYAPQNYELRELLGMVYASLAQTGRAVEQLKVAVRIKPDLAAARVNLGVALVHDGNRDAAADQFERAALLDPGNYDAHHNLGELYVQGGRIAEAQPYLEKAWRIRPQAYDNAYDLAMADYLLGRVDQARQIVNALIKVRDTGELRSLLGQIDEKSRQYIAAANDYEAAVHLDPSEDNLFNWGSEMLLHRTYEPAIAIFQQGVQRYPSSPRMWIGLGLADYSRGKYDPAIKALLAAADLNPRDPRCYVFLSKAYNSSPLQADEVTQRFRRYAELEPENALAQYYYAVSLWKGRRVEDPGTDLAAVESLLRKAIALNDSLAPAHVQLGDLYEDERNYGESIPQYERALQLDPSLTDAYYRLGTDYVHAGEKEKAQREFAVYQKLRAEHLAEVEKERAQVEQFVYSEKGQTASAP
jgi:tetratricopeptide (TPR) repeat protein